MRRRTISLRTALLVVVLVAVALTLVSGPAREAIAFRKLKAALDSLEAGDCSYVDNYCEVQTTQDLSNVKQGVEVTLLGRGRIRITEADLMKLPLYPRVVRIKAVGLPVTDRVVATWAEKCPDLCNLDISCSEISDLSLSSVARMERLKHLVACGTSISDSGLQALHGHPSLEALTIVDTAVTANGLRSLMAHSDISVLAVPLELSDQEIADIESVERPNRALASVSHFHGCGCP